MHIITFKWGKENFLRSQLQLWVVFVTLRWGQHKCSNDNSNAFWTMVVYITVDAIFWELDKRSSKRLQCSLSLMAMSFTSFFTCATLLRLCQEALQHVSVVSQHLKLIKTHLHTTMSDNRRSNLEVLATWATSHNTDTFRRQFASCRQNWSLLRWKVPTEHCGRRNNLGSLRLKKDGDIHGVF